MIIIQIAGHLGADPETRFTPNGQKVTTLRLATNVRKGGKEETVWWRVTIWGDRFDKLMPYLKKGSAIIVVGEMGKPEVYTDKEGRQQVSLDVTAEMIRFSPFGRTDKAGQEPSTGSNNSGSTGSNNSGYGAQQGTGYGSQQQPYASQSSRGFGEADYSKPAHSAMDEDSIPF